MGKELTAHEIWSREQRAKKYAKRETTGSKPKKAEPGPQLGEPNQYEPNAGKPLPPRPVTAKKLPPMVHPEDEPVVGAQIDGETNEPAKPKDTRGLTLKSREELQAIADAVPSKKRGRPKSDEGFDRAAYMREYKRKKRAAQKAAKNERT